MANQTQQTSGTPSSTGGRIVRTAQGLIHYAGRTYSGRLYVPATDKNAEQYK